jgi:hypothetical protein
VGKACDVGLRVKPAHQVAMLHTPSLRGGAAPAKPPWARRACEPTTRPICSMPHGWSR